MFQPQNIDLCGVFCKSERDMYHFFCEMKEKSFLLHYCNTIITLLSSQKTNFLLKNNSLTPLYSIISIEPPLR